MTRADSIPPEVATAYRVQMQRAAPVALALPVVAALVVTITGFRWDVVGVVAGAVGWNVALFLRGPVGWWLKRRGDTELASPWFVAASGPTEELVRLGVLLLLGRDLETALSVGFGWAAIEVLFSVVQGLALSRLMERDDPEAARIRALIPAPPETLMTPAAPWLGIVERIWASALHLGFTVILAAEPLLVLLTIPAHSATNLGLLEATKRWSLGRVQVLGFAWAAVVVLAAIASWQAFGGGAP
jgi:hypothetical protein